MINRFAIACLLGCVACQSEGSISASATPPAPTPAAAVPQASKLPPGHPAIDSIVPPPDAPAPHTALKWGDATGWTKETPSSSMRQAQYRIPKTGADAEDGELVVFYFGQGQGGSVESNVTRWVGQFGQTAPTKSDKKTVANMPVTIVSVDGTYGGGMGMPGAPASGPKENWSLLGAIAETPAGPWFFKLTGPKATVTAAHAEFDKLVASFRIE